MTDHRDGDTCVARVPVFRGLDPRQQSEVAGFARPVRAAAGQFLLTPSDRARRLLVIHEGRVRVSQLMETGHERVLRVLGPGDVVGEASFILGRRPANHAIAETDVVVCAFDHADLAGLVARYPDIAVRMLQVQAERLAAAERMLAALGGADVAARIAAYLLDLPARRGDDGAVVELPMAKKDVASYLGTTPETLSRRLRALADDGVIALPAGRRIVVRDPDELERRAGGATG